MVEQRNDGPATQAECERLKTDGYFIRENFFTQSDIDELERSADAAVQFRNDRFDGYDDVFRRISTRDGFVFVNELFDDSQVRDTLTAFCLRRSIRDMARSLGGENVAHCCYQLVYKFARHDRPMAWHQDEISTPASLPFYNMWIALNDMDIENGCLWALPGIGLDRVYPHEQSQFGLSGWSLEHPNQGAPLRMRRGDVCLMSSKTFHKSGGNRSERPRKAMLIIFMDAAATLYDTPITTTPYA